MAERAVAYLRGAGAEPTRLERLYYRLIANPVFSAFVVLLVRLGLNRRWVVIAIPDLWLGIFFLLPFLIVLTLLSGCALGVYFGVKKHRGARV